MNEPATPAPAPSPKLRRTARDREIRRRRIFALKRRGWTNDEIGEAENLSSERIRQILKDSLDKQWVDPNDDHMRMQIARLDPPLRLAADKVDAGDLRGIDRLLRVMDRLDRYHHSGAASWRENDEAAQAFDAKLADLVARRKRSDAEAAEKAAALESPENSPLPGAAAPAWGSARRKTTFPNFFGAKSLIPHELAKDMFGKSLE
jgi:hypothetical protein